jgi:phosphotransferase system enzyme I (PtsI)
MANIRMADDAAEAVKMKAEGIGLYRTEIELIAAGRLLGEDEYAERYLRVMRAMDGRQVVYRLLDIGSDKPLPFLPLPKEENPSLGWRGGRVLLDRKDLLRPQARALARLSLLAEARVLYPMVVDLEQFRALRAAFMDSIADMPRGRILHGVMFEVPSACLQAEEILREADFASVGTNDLIQYLFAVDRDNALVSGEFHPDRPVFWALLRQIAAAARESGKELSVCGELGGDPKYTARLMAAGIRTVSVIPRRIPAVRAMAAKAAQAAGA